MAEQTDRDQVAWERLVKRMTRWERFALRFIRRADKANRQELLEELRKAEEKLRKA